jgi:uncharacterized protein YjbI with pentapeptide repeats
LSDSNLSGANLRQLSLIGANLSRANLSGADFGGGIPLNQVNLTQAILPNGTIYEK